jgi:hypothetical protein
MKRLGFRGNDLSPNRRGVMDRKFGWRYSSVLKEKASNGLSILSKLKSRRTFIHSGQQFV